jgi:hypothetical protein
LFSKLDIKDGYWREVVPEDDEWNFAYVQRLENPDDDIKLVIPSSLQMGWMDSPAYFCAASETGRDVGVTLANRPEGSLPAHPLEDMMTSTEEFMEIQDKCTNLEFFISLMEVYIDDFIQLAQTTNPAQLLHLSRAILHGIRSLFPPPLVTGHAGEDPVSQKKLAQGDGWWAT